MSKRINNGKIPGYDPKRDAEGFHFDKDRADMACDFFSECLTHIKGTMAGEPFEQEPFQRAVTRNIFGWVDDEGLRRYRTVFCYWPRKNGKSTWSAGIGTYILFCDDEPGAEIYSAAAESKQATIVFNMAKDMVLNDPDLSSRCKIYNRSILIEETGATYQPISAEAYSKHGFNLHAAIIDELHAHPNSDLMDVLESATGSRTQPLIIIITTADFDRPGSPCNEKLEYARKVRDGIIDDPRFLPVIYEATEEDDWRDPKVWQKVNPCWGVSLNPDIVQAAYNKTIGNPRLEGVFKRLHLNMVTKQETHWIELEEWDKCKVEEFEPPDGATCLAGLDLASTTDICALTLYFPDYEGLILPYFWVPSAHPEATGRGKYRPWIEAGHMHTTPGNVTDYDFIRAKINEIANRWTVEVAVDPWNARHLATQLNEQDGIPVVEFRQGYISMNEPCKELERRILQRKICHFGNPVLRWMVSNAMVKTDPAGNIKIDKEKSADKVDGVVAMVMALGRSMNYEAPKKSVYETRGVTFV